MLESLVNLARQMRRAGLQTGQHTILELNCDALVVELHQEADELHDVKNRNDS